MEAGTLVKPLRGPAPLLAIEHGSENLSLPAGAVLAGSAHCELCRRTPLVGETVTVYAAAPAEAWTCDLCTATARGGSLGEPVGRERVRTAAGAVTVRRIG